MESKASIISLMRMEPHDTGRCRWLYLEQLAWAINRQDEPDESGLDERQIAIDKHNEEMEYVPQQTGFTFDPSEVQTEFTVVQSLVDEYKMAFALESTEMIPKKPLRISKSS